MSTKKRKKTLNFFEVHYDMEDSQKYNLQVLFTENYHKLQEMQHTNIQVDDKHYQINWIVPKKLFFVQFSKYSPGESTTAVKTTDRKSVEDAKLKETSPPQNYDFSEGDIIFGIENNKLFVCTNNLSWTCLEKFIQTVLMKFNLGVVFKISVKKPMKDDKVKLITENGIKSIKFLENTVSWQAELLAPKNFFRRMLKQFLYKDTKLSKLVSHPQFYTNFEIGFRGGKINFELIEEATLAINEFDNYIITTGNGNKITPSDITYTDSVEIPSYGNSVQFESTIDALLCFRNKVDYERDCKI